LKKVGLYIHFPFCRRRCFYCHFFTQPFAVQPVREYLTALAAEIHLRRDRDRLIDSVYIGGGSPSLLTPTQLETIWRAVSDNFRIAANVEFSLECNPEDVRRDRLAGFRQLGVNRLSIGVQSFATRDLLFLRRSHSSRQSRMAIAAAMEAGFTNLSIDMMIGLGTQSLDSLQQNFALLGKLSIPHVSVYLLEGVPQKRGHRQDSNDERHYFYSRRALQQLGYRHYEISNFCRPGSACRHNLKYWRNEPYIGIGPAAAGFEDDRDSVNRPDLDAYRKFLAEGRLPPRSRRSIPPPQRRIVTGLRLFSGLPTAAFAEFAEPTAWLLENRLLMKKRNHIAVNPAKVLLLNEILGYFI